MAHIDQRSSRNNMSLVILSARITVRIFYCQVSAEFRKSARRYYTVYICRSMRPNFSCSCSSLFRNLYAMYGVDSCSDMFLCSSSLPFISSLPLRICLQIFDWNESSILVWMQEVSKAIPISLAMPGMLNRIGCHSMPSGFEPSRSPELHHISNINQDPCH
jgi:hypothetical protein